jgi:hypothetical protein
MENGFGKAGIKKISLFTKGADMSCPIRRTALEYR